MPANIPASQTSSLNNEKGEGAPSAHIIEPVSLGLYHFDIKPGAKIVFLGDVASHRVGVQTRPADSSNSKAKIEIQKELPRPTLDVVVIEQPDGSVFVMTRIDLVNTRGKVIIPGVNTKLIREIPWASIDRRRERARVARMNNYGTLPKNEKNLAEPVEIEMIIPATNTVETRPINLVRDRKTI